MTFLFQMVFSFLGMFIVAWFSRAREFRADAGAAVLSSRNNMIAALQRLQANKGLVDQSQPQLATMKINGGKSFMALMSTHPPLEERIAALQRPIVR
jgi:heat shock protein HtpX